MAPDCSSDFYDASNDPVVCNAMEFSSGKQLVASPTEPYIGEVCQGIHSEILTPTSGVLPAGIAPMLPPFVGQYILEQTIVAWQGIIPRYLTSSCLTSGRMLACGLVMPAPYVSDTLQWLFGYPMHLASYPHQNVCQNFNLQCADFIEMAPYFAQDCAASVYGVSLFPSEPQAVMTLDLGFGPVAMISPPNEMENATAVITSECPYGMELPDNPDSEEMLVIPGIACSFICPFPFYTKDEYEFQYDHALVSLSFATVVLLLCNVNFFVTPVKKRNLYIGLMITFLLAYYFIMLVQYASREGNELTCADNVSHYSVNTPLPTANYFSCYFFSLFELAIDWFNYWVFGAVSCEVWCKVVLELKNVKQARYLYLWGYGAASIGMFLLTVLYGDNDIGYVGGFGLLCGWSPSDYVLRFYDRTLPHMVVYCIGAVILCHGIFSALRVSTRAQAMSLYSIWKTYRTLLTGMILFLTTYPLVIFWFSYKVGYLDVPSTIQSIDNWVVCLLNNFVSTDNESYLDTCGMYPKHRVPIAYSLILSYVFYYFSPLIILAVSFSNGAIDFWKKILQPIMPYVSTALALCAPVGVGVRRLVSVLSCCRKNDAKVQPTPPSSLKYKASIITPEGTGRVEVVSTAREEVV